MNSYIKISLNEEIDNIFAQIKNNHTIYNIVHKLMTLLNANIGFRTDIEYRITPVYDFTIVYDIKNYTNKQSNMSIKDLATEKYNTIVNHCKNIDANDFNNFALWLLRSLRQIFASKKETAKLEPSDIFTISAIIDGKPMKTSKLFVKYPKTIEPRYEVVNFEGGTIRYYIDPYVTNNMLCVDYSKELTEFDYFYNGLHMFEHYTTHAWEGMNMKTVLDMNGSTYFNGLCYIYTVSNDINCIRDRLISSILFHIKSSNVDFVKSGDAIRKETMRTISETYILRNLARLGRSDQQAFEGAYSPELFAYWSSLPMNILIISNEKININVDKINEFYKRHHVEAPRPKKTTFDYFPMEAHEIHFMNSQHTFRKPTKDIVKKIYSNKFSSSFYGLDNKTIIYTNEYEFVNHKAGKKEEPEKENIGSVQTYLSPLLFFARFVDNKVVEDYIRKTVFPREASLFESLPLEWSNKNNFAMLTNGDDMDEDFLEEE